jgi:hypothetical protein
MHKNDANDDDGDVNNNSLIQFLYLSACQQRVDYNRQALKVHRTEARLRLELELELD